MDGMVELEKHKWMVNLIGERLITKYLHTVKDEMTPHKLIPKGKE